jgi:hypothetical protein
MSLGNAPVHVHQEDRLPEGLTSPDVYFLPGYGAAAGIADNGQWTLLEAFDGAWQVPLIIRTLPDGAKDALSPYGYSGVYASPSLSPAQVQQAWSATIHRLRELGVISVLLRHSPLVPQASGIPGLVPVVHGHPTIVLETVDADSAWSGLASTCRTRIRKARKNGYSSDVREASSRDLEPSGDFRRLYEGTMQRLNAAPSYFFDQQYYECLLEGLGAKLLLATVRDATGLPVSSSLLMRHEHLLHYHLSGSNPDDARMGSNNLMLWTATEFAAEQGLGLFHLGGGLGPSDGLFHFKRTFGGRTLAYDVSGVIISPELYMAHTELRAKTLDLPTDALLSSGYFPAYRVAMP